MYRLFSPQYEKGEIIIQVGNMKCIFCHSGAVENEMSFPLEHSPWAAINAEFESKISELTEFKNWDEDKKI